MSTRRAHFRARHRANKKLIDRASIIEKYLEMMHPTILQKARFCADTELNLQNNTVHQESMTETVSVAIAPFFEAPLKTFKVS